MFPVRDRQKVAHEILERVAYGSRQHGEFGIERLVDEGVFSAAFPLHDVGLLSSITLRRSMLINDCQWRSHKFSTGGALISGFPSYPHNPLLIYIIHYVTKYFSEK